jgi:hypothetical protein
MSVSSYEGRGLQGHLGPIMSNAEYFAVATYMFPSPANPEAAAEIVMGMTALQITETNRLHTEVTHVYCAYHNVNQEFKTLMINAFEDPYLNALSDEIVGYTNCTSPQFASHLLTCFDGLPYAPCYS